MNKTEFSQLTMALRTSLAVFCLPSEQECRLLEQERRQGSGVRRSMQCPSCS